MARRLLITRRRDAQIIADAFAKEYAPYVFKIGKPKRSRLWRIEIWSAEGQATPSTFLAWSEV